MASGIHGKLYRDSMCRYQPVLIKSIRLNICCSGCRKLSIALVNRYKGRTPIRRLKKFRDSAPVQFTPIFENKWLCTFIFQITYYMNRCSVFVKTMHFHWVCELSALHLHAPLAFESRFSRVMCTLLNKRVQHWYPDSKLFFIYTFRYIGLSSNFRALLIPENLVL